MQNGAVKSSASEGTTRDTGDRLKKESDFDVGLRLTLGIVVIGILLLGGGGWAATAQLAGAVIAQGSVVVERHVKKVQHRDGGIVAEINVSDGDVVTAGDVLIRLDDTQTRAEFGVIQSQLVEFGGRASRLAAERDGLKAIEFPPDFATMGTESPRVIRGEIRLFESNLQNMASKREQLQLRIGQLEQEIEGLASQRDAKADELKLIRKELEQVQILFDKQLTSMTRLYALQREATRIAGEHGGLQAQIARASGQISEIRLQILSVDQTNKADAQRELRQIEAKVAELAERKVAVVDRLKRVELRAPLSGVVHELAVHTIGGVITSAEPVMLIVPKNDDLTVEARVSPADIDQIQIGQPVRLRFSAFNQRTTSELKGHVMRASADVTKDANTGQSYYSCAVEIDEATLDQLGDRKLIPGMPVEVFITTGDRTMLSYLAKPLMDHLARAFREE